MQIKLLPTVRIITILNLIFIPDILTLELQLGGLIGDQGYWLESASIQQRLYSLQLQRKHHCPFCYNVDLFQMRHTYIAYDGTN